MTWLHTYSGLLISGILFVVFYTGTLSYYGEELDVWMHPENITGVLSEDMAVSSYNRLLIVGDNADSWDINLGNNRNPKANISWSVDEESFSDSIIHPKENVRDSIGGNFFVKFHYTLNLRKYGGHYITLFSAFIMLVAVFTGVFTHRRFLKDFFIIRWYGLKRAIIDIHAIVGIVTIPYVFMICFSALLFYLPSIIPFSAEYHYENGFRAIHSYMSEDDFKQTESGVYAKPINNILPVLSKVKSKWPEKNGIMWITYINPYDKNGYLIFYRNRKNISSNREKIIVDPKLNKILYQTVEERNPELITNVFLGLHQAEFANGSLRILFFLLGSLSTLLIATGSILWLNNRIDQKTEHLGSKLIDWSNRALYGGIVFATLVLFLFNRLTPVNIFDRANFELYGFFVSWGLVAAISPFIRRQYYWLLLLKSIVFICFLLVIIDIFYKENYIMLAFNNYNFSFLCVELMIFLSGILVLFLHGYLKRLYIRRGLL